MDDSPTAHPAARRRTLAILAACVLAAFALRVWGMERRSLTFDEIDNAYLSSRSPAAILRFHATMVFNAPGYYLFQHLLLPLGRSEAALRLPSALLGAGCVLATYALGAAVFGPTEGLLAAGLLAISPLHVALSEQARMYTLFHLLAILSSLAFFRMLSRRRLWDSFGFVAATVLAFHVHYLTVFLLVADALLLVLLVLVGPRLGRDGLAGSRARWPAAAVAIAATAAFCLPWALRAGMLSHVPILFPAWRVQSPWGNLAGTLFSFASIASTAPELSWRWYEAGPRLFFLTIFLASIPLAIRERDGRLLLVLAWLALGLAAAVGAFSGLGSYFEARHAAFVLPLWALASARALVWIARSLSPARPGRTLVAAAAACALASAPPLAALASAPVFGSERWREAARWIQRRVGPGEPVVLLDMASPTVSFYLEQWGLAGGVHSANTLDQVREVCASNATTWFVLWDTPLLPPSLDAKNRLLELAGEQETISVWGVNRIVVGRLRERCEAPSASRAEAAYWMNFGAPCPPVRRMQMLYFLALPSGGPIRLDSILAVQREMPGQWTEEKVRRLVDRLAAGG